MSSWTERQLIALPIALLESANQLAALIDPDVGGALTFSVDQTQGDYIIASIPFKSDFWPIVERRDTEEWKATIPQIAESFGREPLPDMLIETLCAAMRLNDEIQSDETP